MCVNDTHKQVSKFVNPKSKRLYVGVGVAEYSEAPSCQWVLSKLFAPGNRPSCGSSGGQEQELGGSAGGPPADPHKAKGMCSHDLACDGSLD